MTPGAWVEGKGRGGVCWGRADALYLAGEYNKSAVRRIRVSMTDRCGFDLV